ncbi:MAG: aquaporin [Actinobacteria bacterium]|nr:aquaporin [Actinomycetota bacterium]
MKKYIAEMIGTFGLVFAGTGAIVVNDVSGGVVSHLGVALTFGLVVMAMIYTFGEVSGAHLNPAVTIGFYLAQRLPLREVFPYVLSQCAGGLLASFMLRLLFEGHLTLGATIPAGSVAQSFVLEIILTFFLMLVILSVSTGAKEKGVMAGAAIGAMVCLAALFAGPVSGASMNPVRSLAPALVAGHTEHLWIYILAPIIGAGLAVAGCRYLQSPGCCSSR